jgi:sugar phosphate isomerase/epimerase
MARRSDVGMTWRFAAATGCCADTPIVSTIDAFHRAGITAIELGTQPGHFDPWSHETVRAVRTRLRRLSIEAVAIHAPGGGLLDLTDPNPHHRHAAIGAILSAGTALRELGGSRVVVPLSDVPRHGEDVDARLGHGVEALGVLGRAFQQMSVRLLVETPLPHLIGGHPDEFQKVLARLDPSIGVCMNTSHTTLGNHWDAFIRVAGSRTMHVHISDHRGRFDDHLPPGESLIDWEHVRYSLERLRFDGWMVLELACPKESLSSYFDLAVLRTRKLFGD